MFDRTRHPELVSGSISPFTPSACGARWMLKRVQHDGRFGDGTAYPTRHPELVSGSLSPPGLRQGGKAESYRKVAPVRVGRLDEIDFPRTVPVLQLLLAGDRRKHVPVHFEPDQPFDAVTRGEAGQHGLAMLPQPLFQARRHADVERTARLACEDVYARAAFTGHGAVCGARWTLKQVQGDGLGVGR